MPRTRSSRVLWLLEEIGEPYELTQIAGDQRKSAEHLRRHPLGRVPALELGDGTAMFESAAICLQLADLYPAAGLIGPVGSAERAHVYQWVCSRSPNSKARCLAGSVRSARARPTQRSRSRVIASPRLLPRLNRPSAAVGCSVRSSPPPT
jgi:glutathione S-transferase